MKPVSAPVPGQLGLAKGPTKQTIGTSNVVEALMEGAGWLK